MTTNCHHCKKVKHVALRTVSLVTFLQVTDPVRMQGGENLNLFTFKLSWIINRSSIYLSIVGGSKHLISWNSSHSSTRGGFLPPVASGPVSPFSGATSLPVSRIHLLISAAFAALLIWPHWFVKAAVGIAMNDIVQMRKLNNILHCSGVRDNVQAWK